MFGSVVFYMDVSWYIVSLAPGLRRFALDAKQRKRPLPLLGLALALLPSTSAGAKCTRVATSTAGGA